MTQILEGRPARRNFPFRSTHHLGFLPFVFAISMDGPPGKQRAAANRLGAGECRTPDAYHHSGSSATAPRALQRWGKRNFFSQRPSLTLPAEPPLFETSLRNSHSGSMVSRVHPVRSPFL